MCKTPLNSGLCMWVEVHSALQSNALQAENAILRHQTQEHQAHAAALQDQAAEQSRTISLGSLQLKQLQSKVGHIRTGLYTSAPFWNPRGWYLVSEGKICVPTYAYPSAHARKGNNVTLPFFGLHFPTRTRLHKPDYFRVVVMIMWHQAFMLPGAACLPSLCQLTACVWKIAVNALREASRCLWFVQFKLLQQPVSSAVAAPYQT